MTALESPDVQGCASVLPSLGKSGEGVTAVEPQTPAVTEPRDERPAAVRYNNPLTAAEAEYYAAVLTRLLRALDGEVVTSALIGDGEGDLLDAERQEVDRVREFLDGRVVIPAHPSHLRGSALAVLDSFADEFETRADHDDSPSIGGRDVPTSADDPSVGERAVRPSLAAPPATPEDFDCSTPGHGVHVVAATAAEAEDAYFEVHGTYPIGGAR